MKYNFNAKNYAEYVSILFNYQPTLSNRISAHAGWVCSGCSCALIHLYTNCGCIVHSQIVYKYISASERLRLLLLFFFFWRFHLEMMNVCCVFLFTGNDYSALYEVCAIVCVCVCVCLYIHAPTLADCCDCRRCRRLRHRRHHHHNHHHNCCVDVVVTKSRSLAARLCKRG